MIEQAKYEVLKRIGKTKIRRYPRLVIARVDGYGDCGFNLLFRFITSNNRQSARSAEDAGYQLLVLKVM
jgi:hypothetical protein